MARGRMISKEASTDRALNSISMEAQLLYCLTLPHLDRDGLIDGHPMMLWRLAAPWRLELMDRTHMLIREWIDIGLVTRYTWKDGDILFFKGFRKHNAGLEYEKDEPSSFPPPPGYVRSAHGLIPEDQEAASRLAESFRQNNAYHKALIKYATTGEIALRKPLQRNRESFEKVSGNNRESFENESGKFRAEDNIREGNIGGGGVQTDTHPILGSSNGGDARGGDPLADVTADMVANAVIELGNTINVWGDWRGNWRGWVDELTQPQRVVMLTWLWKMQDYSQEEWDQIKNVPGLLRKLTLDGKRADLRPAQESALRAYMAGEDIEL